jgi:hypothetical protein
MRRAARAAPQSRRCGTSTFASSRPPFAPRVLGCRAREIEPRFRTVQRADQDGFGFKRRSICVRWLRKRAYPPLHSNGRTVHILGRARR